MVKLLLTSAGERSDNVKQRKPEAGHKLVNEM